MVELLVVIGYLVLMGLLLFANQISVGGIRFLGAKATLSSAFCVIAILMAWYQNHWSQLLVLLPALLACLAGDIVLGIYNRRRKRWLFVLGLILFLLAHLLFLYAFGNSSWQWQLGILPVVGSVGVVLLNLWPRMKLRWMTIPVVGYVLVVTLMVQKASQLWWFNQTLANGLLMVGSWMFLLSDALLLFLYFMHQPPKGLHSTNLIMYYLAMLMIAMSIRY